MLADSHSLLLLRGHLLGNHFWLESVHRVGIGENLLVFILRLATCTTIGLDAFRCYLLCNEKVTKTLKAGPAGIRNTHIGTPGGND